MLLDFVEFTIGARLCRVRWLLSCSSLDHDTAHSAESSQRAVENCRTVNSRTLDFLSRPFPHAVRNRKAVSAVHMRFSDGLMLRLAPKRSQKLTSFLVVSNVSLFRPAQSARAALSGLDFGDRIVGNNLNEAQRNLLVGQGHLHRSAPAVLPLSDLGG